MTNNNTFDINILKIHCEFKDIEDQEEIFCCGNNGAFCGGCLASDLGKNLPSNWDFIPDWMTFKECETLLSVL